MSTREGKAPFEVPDADKECFTWYKIFGDLSTDQIPLIVLHGGPGLGHEYMLAVQDVATKSQIPVIFYDQIGGGVSTGLPEKMGDEGFWSTDLFVKELNNLVSHLGLKKYHILGHSWGGMLGTVFASGNPPGLQKLILMGTPASVELACEGFIPLRAQLPERLRDNMKKCKEAKDYDAPEYKEACMEFYKLFACRCDPWPNELFLSLQHVEEDPTVYATMNGPSEVEITGSLRDFSTIDIAHKIQNKTLLINGQFDEITESATAPLFEKIPKVKWIIMSGCSHMAFWEDRDRFTALVTTFLRSSA